MANTITHKRSTTPGAVPTTGDLQAGELAINVYDGKVFLEKDSGSPEIVTLESIASSHAPPAAPTSIVLTETTGTVEVQFDRSTSTDEDRYEVWRSITGASTGFALIGIVKTDSISSTMVLVDSVYGINDPLYYRIYAVRRGVYSTALTGNTTPTGSVADVSSLSVSVDLNSFILEWRNPSDHRLNYIEIKVHAHVSSGSLSEGSASVCYQGLDENFTYVIPAADREKYHKFWVYTITRT